MLIGGLQKFSLLDYPEKISAIVFAQGCNFRCRFCHNPMLVWPVRVGKLKYARNFIGRQKVHPKINEDDLFAFLELRVGKLDAVVITGGEPCMQKDLPEFIEKIKKLGFLTKLDTNGSYPEALSALIEKKLVNYIAMDLKAPAEKYEEVADVKINFDDIEKSVKIIMRGGLPYEFRTTVVPEMIGKDCIEKMGKIIKGADFWYLQNFKSGSDLVDRGLEGKAPYSEKRMNEMAETGAKFVKICRAR